MENIAILFAVDIRFYMIKIHGGNNVVFTTIQYYDNTKQYVFYTTYIYIYMYLFDVVFMEAIIWSVLETNGDRRHKTNYEGREYYRKYDIRN